jgi:FdhD protein
MDEMFRKVEAFRVDDGISRIEEKIVNDQDVELIINNAFSRKFSISPNSLKEFAVGYLLGEGLVDSVDSINKVEVDNRIIHVEILSDEFEIRKELVVGSDCFGGWRHEIKFVNKVDSNYNISKDNIFEAFRKLKEKSKIWKETGGTHIAGLVNDHEFLSIEDISRHVAVDKVIGAAALKNIKFSESFIVYSGRMPADMLIKVARVGIPIISSNAAPTSSGYMVASEARITLIGFVRGARFNIYTSPHRILI